MNEPAEILEAIRALPRAEQFRLVERVIHELAESGQLKRRQPAQWLPESVPREEGEPMRATRSSPVESPPYGDSRGDDPVISAVITAVRWLESG